jgi:hypothetical protein
MGCDITGWVEFSDRERDLGHAEGARWLPVLDAGFLLGRDYNLFGSLFGVRNATDFAPVAADRGLPTDLSEVAGRDTDFTFYHTFYHSHTWVTWEELAAVDWDELAMNWGDEFSRMRGDPDPNVRPEMISRRQTLNADWHLLMEMAEPLVRRYGADRVRLVVWFDN